MDIGLSNMPQHGDDAAIGQAFVGSNFDGVMPTLASALQQLRRQFRRVDLDAVKSHRVLRAELHHISLRIQPGAGGERILGK